MRKFVKHDTTLKTGFNRRNTVTVQVLIAPTTPRPGKIRAVKKIRFSFPPLHSVFVWKEEIWTWNLDPIISWIYFPLSIPSIAFTNENESITNISQIPYYIGKNLLVSSNVEKGKEENIARNRRDSLVRGGEKNWFSVTEYLCINLPFYIYLLSVSEPKFEHNIELKISPATRGLFPNFSFAGHKRNRPSSPLPLVHVYLRRVESRKRGREKSIRPASIRSSSMDSSIPDNHFHGSNHAETNLLPHLARSPRSVDSKFFSFFFFYIPSAHRRIESWRVPPVVSVARSLKIPGGIVDLLSSTLELPKWLRERERKGEGIRGAHRIDETRTEKGGI